MIASIIRLSVRIKSTLPKPERVEFDPWPWNVPVLEGAFVPSEENKKFKLKLVTEKKTRP